MSERIRPNHNKPNVEGEHVPPAIDADLSKEKRYASTPEEIPTQPTREQAPDTRTELTPIYDPDSTLESPETPQRSKVSLGRVAAVISGVAVTVAAVVVGIKAGGIKSTPGGEVVATSAPFPATTPPEAVVPPPRHETLGATTETLPMNQVYNLKGELLTLAEVRDTSFTVTKAEAISYKAAAENIGLVLESVANFGIHEANEGITGAYVDPKTREKGQAAYNKNRLTQTDLLQNTGLNLRGVDKPNLLEVLLAQNSQNIKNRTFTDATISNIRINDSAPAMNGIKTATIDSTLTLKQIPRGSRSTLDEGNTYNLHYYLSSVTGSDNWKIESYSLVKIK